MVTLSEAQDLDTAEACSQPFNTPQDCSAMNLVLLLEKAGKISLQPLLLNHGLILQELRPTVYKNLNLADKG